MASIFNILDLSVYDLCWGYQEPYCVASKDEVASVCGSSAMHSSTFADIVGIVHESLCDQCERIALGSNCGHFCFLLLSGQTHSPRANSSPTSPSRTKHVVHQLPVTCSPCVPMSHIVEHLNAPSSCTYRDRKNKFVCRFVLIF